MAAKDIFRDAVSKIWIRYGGSEGGIVNELCDRGVPKHDIVLTFHSPFKCQFTELAVG